MNPSSNHHRYNYHHNQQHQNHCTDFYLVPLTLNTNNSNHHHDTTSLETEMTNDISGHQNLMGSNQNQLVANDRLPKDKKPAQTQLIWPRHTKLYFALIFTLLIAILGLLLLDVAHLRHTLAAVTINSNNNPRALFDPATSGRLVAASSDQRHHHLLLHADEFGDDPTNLAELQEDQGRNQDSDHDQDQDDKPDLNQVLPVSGNRRRPEQPRRPAMKQRDPEAVCMTPGCIRAAAGILNNMDNNTNPCDDFYRFACGRWIDNQLIPDEKSALSAFSQNTAELNIKLRALIERPASSLDIDEPPIVKQMRNMYTSCMNLSEIERRGDEPLLEVLHFMGGWPVLGQSQSQYQANGPITRRLGVGSRLRAPQPSSLEGSESFSWLETLIKFRRRGFSHDMIIDLSVVPDVRNSRRFIIELDQSSLGLPDRSYYFKGLNDTTVAAYNNLMVESAVMLGAERHEAQRQMAEVLEFETQLAKISVPREQRRNVSRLYNKMAARELYDLAPNIDWRRYLSSLLEIRRPDGSLSESHQFDLNTEQILVKVPSFIRALDELLVSTEPRIIANYMLWRIVRHSMGQLSRKWRELAHSYSMVTTGRQMEEPRWEQCLGSLDGALGPALSALYIKHHFDRHSKAAALEMVEYIRDEFLRILDEIDWMDEETRREAKLKARGIATFIGYPDELLRNELVEELYANLRIQPTNFYENIRNLRIWSTNHAFNQLRKPNIRGDWKKHARAAVVNAYYNSLENSIEFPAGILQGVFFDANRPMYMNFGAIGYVIGHEITHGFDDRGRQFDRDGNDRNWWKPKTDARFKERAQCIIEQYGNYSVPGTNDLKVNGFNTQGENIADNGGIKQAFRAYRRWTKDHGREARLPGLDFSPDQLFWVSAANIWCGKFRPEVLKLRVNSGVHSPARFRIIGPLSNSPDFSRSFNCPIGSPMNPHKKCSVW